jgi:hypothetical protein
MSEPVASPADPELELLKRFKTWLATSPDDPIGPELERALFKRFWTWLAIRQTVSSPGVACVAPQARRRRALALIQGQYLSRAIRIARCETQRSRANRGESGRERDVSTSAVCHALLHPITLARNLDAIVAQR